MYSQNANRRSAFTLVELLVVVSIIALLIAILIPSLQGAKRNAKRVHCNANLRGIALAGLTYAAGDKKELAIPIGVGDGNPTKTESYTSYVGFGGKSGLGHLKNANTSPYSGSKQYEMGSVHRPLNYVLYKNFTGGMRVVSGGPGRPEVAEWNGDAELELDAYRCVADRGFPGMHMQGWKDTGLSGYDYFGTSYSCNPYLIGPVGGGRLSSNSIYLRPMSRVPNPTNTVLYSEYAMRYAVFANNPQEYDQPQSFCWPWTVGDMTAFGNHGRPWHFNVSFGDGHAAWLKIKGFGRMDGVKLAPRCRGRVENCLCLIQRGLGWQIDTFPSDTITTHKIRTDSNGTMLASRGGKKSHFSIVEK